MRKGHVPLSRGLWFSAITTEGAMVLILKGEKTRFIQLMLQEGTAAIGVKKCCPSAPHGLGKQPGPFSFFSYVPSQHCTAKSQVTHWVGAQIQHHLME